MSRLVGALVLDGGETVIIRWSDGTETEAKYIETYGYTNLFDAKRKSLTNSRKRLIPLLPFWKAASFQTVHKRS